VYLPGISAVAACVSEGSRPDQAFPTSVAAITADLAGVARTS
jgi:hypothetical protein